MLKPILNLFIFFLIVVFSKVSAQYYQIYQAVEVEKYKGKNFLFEGKVYYKSDFKKNSWASLAGRFVDADGKAMKEVLNAVDVMESYKKNDWSSYKLEGKINKKAKYFALGLNFVGTGSYYLDEFRLFIIDGENKIEVPIKNGGFEELASSNWHSSELDKNTKLTVSTEKAFTGKQSLFVDNTALKPVYSLGSNEIIGKFMDVNGVKLYYEVYGQGKPLLLIHGNNESMSSFSKQLEVLSKKYQVIGLDSRGQGNSSSNDTKLTYELMADDVNAFLDKMNLKNVNILGWSDGGNIAVILGMAHPDKINKMAIMGTVLYNNKTSVDPKINKILNQQVAEMKANGVAENDMDYRLKMLLLTEPNINPDSLQKIKAPTLVMAGEYDIMPEKHTKLIADKIPNSKMLIFKSGDHEMPSKNPDVFNKAVLDFFEEI